MRSTRTEEQGISGGPRETRLVEEAWSSRSHVRTRYAPEGKMFYGQRTSRERGPDRGRLRQDHEWMYPLLTAEESRGGFEASAV